MGPSSVIYIYRFIFVFRDFFGTLFYAEESVSESFISFAENHGVDYEVKKTFEISPDSFLYHCLAAPGYSVSSTIHTCAGRNFG